jgi:ArsR family transcriptional regulator, arsenate/arsenite/antimonite-responsive transcriptional repressor
MKKRLSDTCYVFFSTLSNPTRLAILELLREGPRNVTEISGKLDQEQSSISHNLKPLVRCGFVSVERRWKEKIFTINTEIMEPLFKVIENHAKRYCPTHGNCIEIAERGV